MRLVIFSAGMACFCCIAASAQATEKQPSGAVFYPLEKVRARQHSVQFYPLPERPLAQAALSRKAREQENAVTSAEQAKLLLDVFAADEYN